MITIQQEILQNLRDAGCDESSVEEISAALVRSDRCTAIRLLERQRPGTSGQGAPHREPDKLPGLPGA